MIGAHWFTDIIVGSMTVILIGLPWVLLTPLSDRLITFLTNHYREKQTFPKQITHST